MFTRFIKAKAVPVPDSPARRRQSRNFADMATETPPRSPLTTLPNGHASPIRGIPRTPRTSMGGPLMGAQISPSKLSTQHDSPTEGLSLSASQPFDWEAVRLRKPPPYDNPMQGARIKAARKSEAGLRNAQKRTVRKKNWFQRIASIPSRVVDEIQLFPHNIPLPEPKASAWIIGGLLHALNLFVRISQSRQVAEEELPWADLYNEHRGASWFDWTTPVTILLILSSFLIAFRLLSHNRIYFLHHRENLVNSPRAAFVDTQIDLTPLETPSLVWRALSWLFYQFSVSWRFLLNFKPPAPRVAAGARVERVQQLSVWEPGELEMSLFAVYSPAHSLLWLATTGSNWIVMFTIMGIIGLQIHLLTSSYAGLIKDKGIISAEVMNEYNEKYVNPRINPIRHDKSVMTHQAEVINYWDGYN